MPLSGDEIKRIRKRLKMNQGEFAEILGVGRSTVQAWEQGSRQIGKANEAVIRSHMEEHGPDILFMEFGGMKIPSRRIADFVEANFETFMTIPLFREKIKSYSLERVIEAIKGQRPNFGQHTDTTQ